MVSALPELAPRTGGHAAWDRVRHRVRAFRERKNANGYACAGSHNLARFVPVSVCVAILYMSVARFGWACFLKLRDGTLSGAREVLLQGSFYEVSLALVGVASLA